MIDITVLDKTQLLSDEFFREIFDLPTCAQHERARIELEAKARELGCLKEFLALYKAYKRDRKTKEQAQSQAVIRVDGCSWETCYDFTTFPAGYQPANLRCGSWTATMSGGVYQWLGPRKIIACYHPILPVKRLVSEETGEERVVLAWYRDGAWHTLPVARDVVASSKSILQLSTTGILVNSGTAAALVDYLATCEAEGEDDIPIERCTSKLGWHRTADGGFAFLPYARDQLTFDGADSFRDLYAAIRPHGDSEVWYGLARAVRASGRLEPRILLAASFASVLVSRLHALPFFVDVWGQTESGKTVCLMLSASVWGDPAEGQYICDFSSTDTALEVRADLLTHLPMFLDDTSKASKRVRENFENVVYSLCSGKGRSRSNRGLGIRRESRWGCVFLSTGERPLSSYVYQGGAINRILEIEAGENLFDDPSRVAKTVRDNFGHAGFDFISALEILGDDYIRGLFDRYRAELSETAAGTMQKQSAAMAVVLTADKLASDYLFSDGQGLTVADVSRFLQEREAVSDTERCYRYIVDAVLANPSRFDPDDPRVEQWGRLKEEGEQVVAAFLLPRALDSICASAEFDSTAFLSWAYGRGLLECDKGTKKFKTMKYMKRATKGYLLRLSEPPATDADGFAPLDRDAPDFS